MSKARIKELREKQAREHEAAKAEWDKVDDKTPEGERKEAEARFDGAMDKFDEYEAEITRLERMERASQRLSDADDQDDRERRERRRPENGNERHNGDGDPEVKPEIRSVFNKALRMGRQSLTEEEDQVFRSEGMDSKDPEVRALATGTGSAGGYTVPSLFRDKITEALAIWGPMLDPNVVDLLITDSGASMEWPTVDDTASRGGIVAENAAVTDDGGNDPVFGTRSLGAYMYSSEPTEIPLQLLQDSNFDFEGRLIPKLFRDRMARTGNDALTTGTGSGQPQGIVTGAGTGITATATAAIADDEFIDLQHKVDPAYRRNPGVGWMFNDNVLKAARKLKDANDRYIWQRPDMETGAPAKLLDYGYNINPSMADPAASSVPVLFGDFKEYTTRLVMGWELFIYRELFMLKKQIGFEVFGRIDGVVSDTRAIKKMTMAAS